MHCVAAILYLGQPANDGDFVQRLDGSIEPRLSSTHFPILPSRNKVLVFLHNIKLVCNIIQCSASEYSTKVDTCVYDLAFTATVYVRMYIQL